MNCELFSISFYLLVFLYHNLPSLANTEYALPSCLEFRAKCFFCLCITVFVVDSDKVLFCNSVAIWHTSLYYSISRGRVIQYTL